MGIIQTVLKWNYPIQRFYYTGEREDKLNMYVFTEHMLGTVPGTGDIITKSSVVPAIEECFLWRGRQTKICKQTNNINSSCGRNKQGLQKRTGGVRKGVFLESHSD